MTQQANILIKKLLGSFKGFPLRNSCYKNICNVLTGFNSSQEKLKIWSF